VRCLRWNAIVRIVLDLPDRLQCYRHLQSYVATRPLANRELIVGCSRPDNHATRNLACDRALDLALTIISISCPSTNKSRIRRSIEKPDNLPCLRAEIFDWSIPRIAAAWLCVSRRR